MPPYRERLSVPPWWHLGALGFGVLIGGEAVLSTDLGVAAAVIGGFALAAELFLRWLGSRVVAVDGGALRAGNWRLPVTQIRAVAVLDPVAMTAQLRSRDPDVYRCTAGWIRTGLLLEVDDPQDLPRWLISTRRPQRLAAALAAAR